MRKKEREEKLLELNKMIEHISVDIKYIPKEAMTDPMVIKSLEEMSELVNDAIKKLEAKRKKKK